MRHKQSESVAEDINVPTASASRLPPRLSLLLRLLKPYLSLTVRIHRPSEIYNTRTMSTPTSTKSKPLTTKDLDGDNVAIVTEETPKNQDNASLICH